MARPRFIFSVASPRARGRDLPGKRERITIGLRAGEAFFPRPDGCFPMQRFKQRKEAPP